MNPSHKLPKKDIDITYKEHLLVDSVVLFKWGRRGRDRTVDGFTTTYICNQWLSPLKLRVRIPFMRGVLIQHYVIKFVSDLRNVSGFLRVLHQ